MALMLFMITAKSLLEQEQKNMSNTDLLYLTVGPVKMSFDSLSAVCL